MRDLLTFLLEGITGSKDFEIRESEDNGLVTLEVSAPKDLMGMIIGKEGKTIRTIRNLVKIRATLEKKAVNLEVLEAVTN